MPLLVSGRVSDNKLAEDHRSPPRRGGQAGRGASSPAAADREPEPEGRRAHKRTEARDTLVRLCAH